jgi:hypothetical protein
LNVSRKSSFKETSGLNTQTPSEGRANESDGVQNTETHNGENGTKPKRGLASMMKKHKAKVSIIGTTLSIAQ